MLVANLRAPARPELVGERLPLGDCVWRALSAQLLEALPLAHGPLAAEVARLALGLCGAGWMKEAVKGLAESAAEPGEIGVLRVEGRRHEHAEIPPEPNLPRPASWGCGGRFC